MALYLTYGVQTLQSFHKLVRSLLCTCNILFHICDNFVPRVAADWVIAVNRKFHTF